MDEYISREAVINITAETGAWETQNRVRELPAADVQFVKHGRWISQGDDMWLCSNCKKNIIYSMHESDRVEKQRYCCRCGARMIKDGDAE